MTRRSLDMRFLLTVIIIGVAVPLTAAHTLPLEIVADLPLTNGPSRFDYQAFDAEKRRLFIAHLGAGTVTAVDVRKRAVIGDVAGVARVHGVIVVPERGRVYATATATNEVVAINEETLRVEARIPAGEYPDGLAYDLKHDKIYVSDKRGATEAVIDVKAGKLLKTLPLGGEAGNTKYDAVSGRIFVNAHGVNELVEIDTETDTIAGRYGLGPCEDNHGLYIDTPRRLAFIACEGTAQLVAFDLKAKKVLATYPVGRGPDVLDFDTTSKRLYVAAESGVVSVFDERDGRLEKIGEGLLSPKAHSVAVDSRSHQVFFPLENVDGKPVLRIMRPR